MAFGRVRFDACHDVLVGFRAKAEVFARRARSDARTTPNVRHLRAHQPPAGRAHHPLPRSLKFLIAGEAVRRQVDPRGHRPREEEGHAGGVQSGGVGSSISHFDSIAFPNQLMEPAINGDLTSSVEPPQDLTVALLTDLGWFTDRDGVLDGTDQCLGSNIDSTVVLGDCNSGATNDVLSSGCSVADFYKVCEPLQDGPYGHGAYVACVALTSNVLKAQRVITGREAGAIVSCAAHN
jgi:hypothetical protein